MKYKLNFDFFACPECIDGEIWKDVVLPEGFTLGGNYKKKFEYEISNLGRVKNKTRNKFVSLHKDKDGYLLAMINGKNFRVHRLVAKAFIPNPNNYEVVNHKDECKRNNSVDNLEWCTNQYNIAYSNKRKVALVDRVTGNIIKIYEHINDCAEDGFTPSGVSRVIANKDPNKRCLHRGCLFVGL